MMAFGQQPGPPASARQMQELLELLRRAGHADLRDARGPLGLTQRQAGGRFTRDEAAAFIERLQGEEERAATDEGEPAPPAPVDRRARPRAPGNARARPGMLSAAEQALRRVPSEQLAAELERRGWIVSDPENWRLD